MTTNSDFQPPEQNLFSLPMETLFSDAFLETNLDVAQVMRKQEEAAERSLNHWQLKAEVFAEEVRHLANQTPVYVARIVPAQVYRAPQDWDEHLLGRDRFMRFRALVLRKLRKLKGVAGVRGVAGLVRPYYYPLFGTWLVVCDIVILGDAAAEEVVRTLERGRETVLNKRVFGMDVWIHMLAGEVVGPMLLEEFPDHLPLSTWPQSADQTGLGRFLSVCQEKQVMVLQGIRQLPGGRLVFEN